MTVENGPQGEDIWAKQERWHKDGFARINQALTQTNIIPQLHGLFKARGVKEDYLVLDGVELSRGFPVPVRTRYIVPTFLDNGRKGGGDQPYPGVAVSEILGLGVRSIQIQIGLNEQDFWKVAKRISAVMRRDPQGEWMKKRPEWWTHPYPAADLSQPYDMADIEESVQQIAADGESTDSLWSVYIWGNAKPDKRVVLVVYEYESKSGGIDTEWNKHQDAVSQGLNNTGQMMDALIQQGK